MFFKRKASASKHCQCEFSTLPYGLLALLV